MTLMCRRKSEEGMKEAGTRLIWLEFYTEGSSPFIVDVLNKKHNRQVHTGAKMWRHAGICVTGQRCHVLRERGKYDAVGGNYDEEVM